VLTTHRRRWLAVGLGSVVVAGLGVTIAGAQTDDTPRGTDPLSAAEEEVAVGLARGSNPGESTGVGDDDVVLLVERHQEEKVVEEDGRRRADVFVYSYDDDVLTWTVVDTATGEVDESTVLPDTQLPLIDSEKEQALEIATADEEFQQLLATRFRQGTGRDLVDPATDLILQPMVFLADSNPVAVQGPATRCGEHRCAQLLIQSSDHFLVNLNPVVDLSTGRLVSRDGFFR
jgi:hypothetical protein